MGHAGVGGRRIRLAGALGFGHGVVDFEDDALGAVVSGGVVVECPFRDIGDFAPLDFPE